MPTKLITAWRIVRTKHAETAFTGEGAMRASGRWHSRGTPMVYAAESRALAVLELMAHLEADELLKHYRLISVTFDESLLRVLQKDELPSDWKKRRAPETTRQIGDSWVAANESVVLKVPSAVIEQENNYLLNPSHPDFGQVVIGAPQAFRFDRRLH
jgi:RES domain-containing protein